MPVWFGVFLFILATLFLVLPINTIINYIDGIEPNPMMFAWAIGNLILCIIGYAWGADIVRYHDKKVHD